MNEGSLRFARYLHADFSAIRAETQALEDEAREAARRCPVQAIRILEADVGS